MARNQPNKLLPPSLDGCLVEIVSLIRPPICLSSLLPPISFSSCSSLVLVLQFIPPMSLSVCSIPKFFFLQFLLIFLLLVLFLLCCAVLNLLYHPCHLIIPPICPSSLLPPFFFFLFLSCSCVAIFLFFLLLLFLFCNVLLWWFNDLVHPFWWNYNYL